MPPTLSESETELLRKIGTPSRFARYASKDVTGYQWEPAKHLLHMEREILGAVMDEETQSFIQVNMPPRHGKSSYVSLFLPAWLIGMFPHKRVLLVTYSDDFSASWSAGVKNLLTKFGKNLFGRGVDKSISANAEWRMESSFGGMIAVGIGGQITGKGGDFVIVDDVIKNWQEAQSPAEKKKHYEWYTSTLRSRLEPGGVLLITATRWAEDDLSGQIESNYVEGADKFSQLVFPAICEPPDDWKGDDEDYVDELGRRSGEALWPERWPAHVLNQIRMSNLMTPQVWDALYQQRPVARKGSMFPEEAWRRYPSSELAHLKQQCVALVRVWDLASSEDSGDWTVGTLIGIDARSNFFIFDVQRFRKDPYGVETAVLSTAFVDGPHVKIRIEEERSGAGKTVIANYKRQLTRYDVDGITPKGKKEDRASVWSSKVIAGLAWIPSHDVDWVAEWIAEHRKFPRGRYDDQVDTGVHGFDHLADLSGGTTLWTPSGWTIDAEAEMRALLEHGVLR